MWFVFSIANLQLAATSAISYSAGIMSVDSITGAHTAGWNPSHIKSNPQLKNTSNLKSTKKGNKWNKKKYSNVWLKVVNFLENTLKCYIIENLNISAKRSSKFFLSKNDKKRWKEMQSKSCSGTGLPNRLRHIVNKPKKYMCSKGENLI